jgi:hypothetical protein
MHTSVWPHVGRLHLAAALVACASSGQRSDACAPVPDDQWTGGTPVYRACSVDRAAQPIGAIPRVEYAESGSAQSCFRATVTVVVDTSGKPVLATVRAVRTNDPGFLQALIQSLEARRYSAAERAGQRVPQIVEVDAAMQTLLRAVRMGTSPPVTPRRPSC